MSSEFDNSATEPINGGENNERNPASVPVQVIVKTFDLLEAISFHGEMGISKLAEETGLTKSSVYRFVQTLVQLDYVKRDENYGRYDLTLKLFEVGATALTRSNVLEASRDVAYRIASETGEAVHIAVLDQTDIVYIDTADSAHALSMKPRIGERTTAHCTALGRVLLANEQESRLQELFEHIPLEARTGSTVTDFNALVSILQTVRQEGYSVDYEEYEEGLICVAVPLRNHTGAVVAAMAVAAPVLRMKEPRVAEIVDTMKAASQEVDRLVGRKLRVSDGR